MLFLHAAVQGPFPLALIRHWQSQSPPAFQGEMPIVHIGAPDINVRLNVLLSRPLPIRPAAPGPSSGAKSSRSVLTSPGSAANGVHVQKAPRGVKEQQPARVSEQPQGSREIMSTPAARQANVNDDIGVAVSPPSQTKTVSSAAVPYIHRSHCT
jgi:hypothetical protein